MGQIKPKIDTLNLLRGRNFIVNDYITMHIPKLGEICDYGESDYFSMVTMLCSVGVSLCWQLEKIGIPFDEISDYELFIRILSRHYETEQTSILFGNKINFSKTVPCLAKEDSDKVVLAQEIDGEVKTVFTEDDYNIVVKALRGMHGFKRDDRVAGTASCRRAFIEDAEMEYQAILQEGKKSSTLLPLISAMTNMEGFKFNIDEIWDMNIFAFMDSVKRIEKIKNANLLLQSGYSGFGVDLKKIKKEELNYMGEL